MHDEKFQKRIPKIKISFISQFFNPDSAATGQFLAELTDLLAEEEFKIHVKTGMPAYANFKNKFAKKYEVKRKNLIISRTNASRIWPDRIRGRAINGLLFCIRISFFLLRLSPKKNLIVYSTEPPYLHFLGWLINKIRNTKYVIILYDLYPEILVNLNVLKERNWLIRLWKFLNQKSFNSSSKIIVLNDSMKKYLLQNYKFHPNKIEVIPSWCNPDKIFKLPRNENKFVIKNNLKNKFVILYSGNHGRCHDLISILGASLLLKNQNDIKFLFIGAGAQKKRIKKLANELNLYNCIFLPYQDQEELIFSLGSANLAIVSMSKGSQNYISPSKLYGHLAAATPIAIISPANSYLEKLVNLENFGKWFDNGDSKALADWILHLKSNQDKAEEFGLNGLNYFLENATSKIILKKYKNLFLDLM